MARPGVTYQDISSAANELKGQGKNITIENVRAILGTGSIGTINNHLRKWKEAQNSTHKIASKENLPAELVSLLKGLWDTVLTQSTEQFAPIETEMRSEITALKEEVQKFKNNNQRWQKLFNQWQQEKADLDKEKLTLEQALSFTQKENAEMMIKHDNLYQQLQEKQERIYELNRLHKQAQENLEHYRESAREQRLLDQQQFEQQKQQLLLDIKNINDQLMAQREKISEIQQQYQLLQHSYATLGNQNDALKTQFQQVSQKLEKTEKIYIETVHTNQHLQSQCQSQHLQLKEKTDQLTEIQIETKLVVEKLAEANQSINHLKDQNKLLAHEKWLIGQERAQLEGQLKQFQKTIA